MALIRILVDGYSLLHSWLEIAPGKPRHSAAAREELVHRLRQYRDATATAITVVFDGSGPKANSATEVLSTPELEIIYSKAGQTADDLIERVATRLVAYGEVLVVTDDSAERETVAAAGASSMSCRNFMQLLQGTLEEMQGQLKRHNRSELNKFRTG